MSNRGRSVLTALLFVGAIVFPAYSQADTINGDGFTVSIPDGFGKAEKKEQTLKSPSGPIKQITYVSKDKNGAAMIVTYSEVSGKIVDPAAMMSNGRDSLLKSLKASLEAENKKTIDGQPAMSFLYSAAEPRPIFARTDLVVSGPRMYQLIFLGYDQEARRQAGVDQFFSSFHLTKKPGRAPAAAAAPATPPSANAAPAPPVEKKASAADAPSSM